MRSVGKMDQSAACLRGRQRILTAWVILVSMGAVVGAQINVNETGLHGGEGVYGLVAAPAPDPNVNAQDITVLAWGETDPSLYAVVWFNAYGINSNVSLVNNGDVTVTATGGNVNLDGTGVDVDARTIAYGVFTNDGPITNRGRIDVTALGGNASSVSGSPLHTATAAGQVYGIYTHNGAVDNSGAIEVAAQGGQALAGGSASAGAEAYGVLDDDGDATNSGDIAVTAIGGTAEGGNQGETDARAAGLSINGAVDNSGDLTVTSTGGTSRTDGTGNGANAEATGFAEGISAQGPVNNRGNIHITATGGTAEPIRGGVSVNTFAQAFAIVNGIFAQNGATNSGTVTATAVGGTAVNEGGTSASATAHGIRGSGTFNNSGDLVVTALGGAATSEGAIGASADASAETSGLNATDLNNTGAVTAVATGGTATGDQNADAHSYAQGLRGTNVNNTGALSVTATAGTATAPTVIANAEADGIVAGGNVNNSGAILVAATAPEGSPALAYGIRMDSSGNLTNTGTIQTFATTAYELYVASGTTTLVDRYNVTLDGDPTRGSLGVADGATLALNNANLMVTGISGQTRWDTPYNLFDIDSSGVVDGNLASVQPANPNTRVSYYDQGTAGRVDDAVSLAYAPIASQALVSANVERQLISQAVDVVNNYMGVTVLQDLLTLPSSGLLASAGSTAESLGLAETAHDKTSGAFVQPYYSQIDSDTDPLGYEASVWGITGGFQRFVDTTLLNLHLGYGRADIEYTGSGANDNCEDQDLVIGGFHGLTRWNPWTLRYGLDGFYGWHDYQGLTGWAMEDEETASYNSYGVVATLLAGHIYQLGPLAFLPEAGVNWLWLHRERYTTDATDPTWDTDYSATNDYDLYGVAALRWLSSFQCHDLRVTPSASVGVRHLLTDDETSVWQSVEGATPALVESGRDRTAMTVSGSLLLSVMPHALSVAYDGSYSPDTQQHSFWLRYSLQF